MNKHQFVLGISYTINLGINGKYCYEYLNIYDYVKLTLREDIKIHDIDIYNYNRCVKLD